MTQAVPESAGGKWKGTNTMRLYVDSEAVQPILNAAKAAGYEQRTEDVGGATTSFVGGANGEENVMRLAFTYNGRVQTCEINQIRQFGMGRDEIVKWFERERAHALAPADSQLASAYSAAKRHDWTEIYRDGGVTFRLADTTMRAEFSEAGHLTGLDRTQGGGPREVPTDDAFGTLMTWLGEAPLIIADERKAASSASAYHAHREGDPREGKLPEWVRKRLTKLREELRTAELMYKDTQATLERVRDAAELDPGDDTGVRYETEHGEQYLPSGGTLHIRVGHEEISVTATEKGVALRTLADGLTVFPFAFRDIEVRVILDEQ